MEGILRKEIVTNKVLIRTLGVLTFVVFTALGAFVRIPLPFTPVPITLQTFFVLLGGAFLGSSLGVVAQASYIFLGMLGLPIFAGAGSGMNYLLGPTGGYLIGFILAGFFVGKFINYSRNSLYLAFAILCAADLLLLSCGIIWLKVILGYPLKKLLLMGFIPFIPGDLLKAGLAAFLYFRLKSRLKEIF